MNTPDTVHTRRDAILAAASAELHHARDRRTQRARLATAFGIVALGMAFFTLVTTRPETSPDRSIDFAVVRAQEPTSRCAIDFAIVRDTTRKTALVTLTDAEAEAALEESGLCIKIFRIEHRTLLVDCSTGARAHIP
ncbi:MAG: hypothetical protein QM516_00745 [Limnohabitans sp.]|jgi:hypothetical protein|nr:hypothetical protein [Limnohabitans sp.]